MAQRIRAMDWSATPLGPIDRWSPTLRTTVRLMLANRFPLLLWWGPELIQLYNDAYIPVPGTKHPKALGQAGPRVLAGDLAHHRSADRHALQRRARRPGWTTSFSRSTATGSSRRPTSPSPTAPCPTKPRRAGSAACSPPSTRSPSRSSRSGASRRCASWAPAPPRRRPRRRRAAIAAEVLSRHAKDVPFALVYLVEADASTARLAGAAGVEPGAASAPLEVSLEGDGERGWPVAAAFRGERMEVVEDLATRLSTIPPGPWSDPPRQALVLPIPSNVQHRLAGLLVVGVSARIALDEAYVGFSELVAAQVGHGDRERRAPTRRSGGARRRWPRSTGPRPRSSPTSATSSARRSRCCSARWRRRWPRGAPTPRRTCASSSTVAHRNALRLLKLVNTLLDFSRIEAGRVEAAYEPADLAVVHRGARRARSARRSSAPASRSGWTARRSRSRSYVDRDMWEKIVLNLLSNAFKFTFDGEIAVSVCAVRGDAFVLDGARHRRRHPGRRAAPPLRAVPSRAGRPRADPRGHRHRAGAGAGARPAPRRQGRGRERGGRGHEVHGLDSGGHGPPAAGPHRGRGRSASPWRAPPRRTSRRRCAGCPMRRGPPKRTSFRSPRPSTVW